MKFAAALLALGLGGCALIQGKTQEITVNSDPVGASCVLMRQGQLIATIYPTPGTVRVEKNGQDITILCDRAGYAEASFIAHPVTATAAELGNKMLGWAVDVSIGRASCRERV